MHDPGQGQRFDIGKKRVTYANTTENRVKSLRLGKEWDLV